MKIGYLVWRYDDMDTPEFWKEEPGYCYKYKMIVYSEIEDE